MAVSSWDPRSRWVGRIEVFRGSDDMQLMSCVENVAAWGMLKRCPNVWKYNTTAACSFTLELYRFVNQVYMHLDVTASFWPWAWSSTE